MRLPQFELLKPHTLEEACSMLSKHRGEAKIVAGGTDALINMEQRLFTPQYVISLKGVSGLDYIDYDGQNGVRLGALVTIDSLNNSPVVREKLPILSQAAKEVGVPPLRYMGTLGGNLCLDTRCLYYNQSCFWREVRGPCLKTGGRALSCGKGQ